ncbi:MAG: hypothetical protein K6G89_04305 [Clostridia bacterium]|nr:hypothetical protein [Clostridia bacterium]
MKFVYQTRIAGALEPPALDSYRICAMKLAALCPGRTSFKGSFLKESFRETLGLLRRAGANAIERNNGSAVEPASNREAAYRILFAKEIGKFDSIISEKNFKNGTAPENGATQSAETFSFSMKAFIDEPERYEKKPETGAGEPDGKEALAEGPKGDEEKNKKPHYEGSALDFILSRDVIYLSGDADENDVIAIVAADILNGHSQKIILDLPPEDVGTLRNSLEAVNSLGGCAVMEDSCTLTVDGGKAFTAGNIILPASDWHIVVPALCCSAIGFDVDVKNTFEASPFAVKKEFIDVFSKMELIYTEDEEGNAFFVNSAGKTPARVDAAECGDYLPYFLFMATQTDGVSEIYNITEEILERNNHAFYYTVAELKKLGADFTSRTGGSMFILGKTTFDGGVRIDCHNNYDLACVAVLATLCSKKANVIENCDSVEWICPDFWRLFKSIGGFAE